MNKARAPSEGDVDLNFRIVFYFQSYIESHSTIIVELDEIKLLVCIHYDRKIGTSRSKLGFK